jgi:hypothetical protein
MPARLALQPLLSFIDLAWNNLTGGLDTFAAALAPTTLVGAPPVRGPHTADRRPAARPLPPVGSSPPPLTPVPPSTPLPPLLPPPLPRPGTYFDISNNMFSGDVPRGLKNLAVFSSRLAPIYPSAQL